jgi:hypothetical protein
MIAKEELSLIDEAKRVGINPLFVFVTQLL